MVIAFSLRIMYAEADPEVRQTTA